ncbi:MAG TPA: ester cyclase [Anaerolineales bacterium]|nr:ester cyclase [Anaerolineales bacterium]
MTTEQNKAVIRKYAELTNARDLEGAFAHFSPSFVDHAVRPGMPQGIEGTRLFFNMLFTAFPDLRATIQDIIAEGDKVVDRMTCEGTHQGMFMGAPPTGKRVMWSFIDINRIVDGKVVEHWAEVDTIGIMQQLGLVPPPSGH